MFVTKKKFEYLKTAFDYEKLRRENAEDNVVKLLNILVNAGNITISEEQEKYIDELVQEYSEKYGECIIKH